MFPPTTELDPIIGDENRRDEVARHVASIYAIPLAGYLGSLPEVRAAGIDPDEIVNRLVMKKLLDGPEYLDQWRASGKRLRVWLVNGVHFELKTMLKKTWSRHGRETDLEDADPSTFGGPGLTSDDAPVDEHLRRETARALLAEAMDRAEARCPTPEHWECLRRQTFEGQSFATIGSAMGVSPGRAGVMARTARRHLRESLATTLQCEGVDGETPLRHAIDELLDDLSGSDS